MNVWLCRWPDFFLNQKYAQEYQITAWSSEGREGVFHIGRCEQEGWFFFPISRCLLPWFKNDLWEELSWGFLEQHQSEASQAMGTLSACSFLFLKLPQNHCSRLSFLSVSPEKTSALSFFPFLLSSLCLVAFWFLNLLLAVMLCLQYSVTTSHHEEHSKVSHFSFAGRSEKMTFDTVEYIFFHGFC